MLTHNLQHYNKSNEIKQSYEKRNTCIVQHAPYPPENFQKYKPWSNKPWFNNAINMECRY